jgi:NADH pyrophosphatase NudC (nudix superfamily)
MAWITLILALGLSLLMVAYVVWPLLKAGAVLTLADDDRLTELISRKDAVVRSLKDLEFDLHVGKLNQTEYQRFEERLSRQAIGLLQQIEKIAPESANLDAQLEQEIVRLRKTHDPSPPTSAIAPIPVVAQPTRATNKPRFCPHCGQSVQTDHKFCAHCGSSLSPT